MTGLIDNTAYYETYGYRFYNGHTFKYFTTLITWPDAKTACEVLGGHLAISTDADKNAFLTSLITAPAWLGATDEETEGSWKWLNGEEWSYTNWASPQPDNAGGAEHYLELYASGLWNDLPATSVLTFICEWDFDLRFLDDSGLTLIHKTILDTKTGYKYETFTLDILQDNGYQFFNGHTFKYIDTANTWSNAKVICEADKNSFLTELVTAPAWLGGTDEAEEGHWQWITGEEWNYSNWSSGEPNNAGENEPYLELYITGLWNDFGGKNLLSYVCEWDFDFRSFLIRNHEGLNNLKGGAADEHYHLTGEELSKTQKALDLLYPEGAEEPIINHEETVNLKGGDDEGHFHLTRIELGKLKMIIDALFPDGAAELIIPTIPSGQEPETPSKEKEGELFGGLPTVTPPQWTSVRLPNYSNKVQYSCYDAVHTMYYGKSAAKKGTTPKTGLHVLLEYGSNSSCYLVFTQDLVNWTAKRTFTKKTEAGSGISQYMYINTGNTSSNYQHRLYVMLPGRTSKSNMIRFLYGENNSGSCSEHYISQSNVGSKVAYTACCYSDKHKMYIFVSKDGHVARADASTPKTHKVLAKEKDNNCGIDINPGCVAWSNYSNVFCATGPQGVAISQDAKGAWTVLVNAPKNLVDLVYREDLPGLQNKGFFARSAVDKCFYASADGVNWLKVSTTPIPLREISAVDYNPDLGWYCAIGGKSLYAYFSKDLVSWVSTRVSSSPIDMGSVIWMPSTQKYVLMPKSGSMFYTFSPADWSE